MSIAARMDKRVTLQRQVVGRDAAGQHVAVWENARTDGDGKVFAHVADLTGRERVAAGAQQASVQTKITIYDRAGVVPAMRVLHGADVYRIDAVLRQDNGTLLLMCARGVA
jgi:SPP1 family predicted phage head-tail adaptor